MNLLSRVGVPEHDSERPVGVDLAPSSRAHHSSSDVSEPSFAKHRSSSDSTAANPNTCGTNPFRTCLSVNNNKESRNTMYSQSAEAAMLILFPMGR